MRPTLLTRSRRARRAGEAGMALPSSVAAVSVAGVVAAAALFALTGTDDQPRDVATPVRVDVSPSPSRSSASPTIVAAQPAPEKKPKPTPEPEPEVSRGEVYVEVYNNSGISGLAGSTASRAAGVGWNVVGSDNWYGTIAESTVYYPSSLKTQATTLAKDLGISRTKPTVDPMRGDRLTVILTADYA